jgi:hypothetical protein
VKLSLRNICQSFYQTTCLVFIILLTFHDKYWLYFMYPYPYIDSFRRVETLYWNERTVYEIWGFTNSENVVYTFWLVAPFSPVGCCQHFAVGVPEDGGLTSLRDVDNNLEDWTASQAGRDRSPHKNGRLLMTKCTVYHRKRKTVLNGLTLEIHCYGNRNSFRKFVCKTFASRR